MTACFLKTLACSSCLWARLSSSISILTQLNWKIKHRHGWWKTTCLVEGNPPQPPVNTQRRNSLQLTPSVACKYECLRSQHAAPFVLPLVFGCRHSIFVGSTLLWFSHNHWRVSGLLDPPPPFLPKPPPPQPLSLAPLMFKLTLLDCEHCSHAERESWGSAQLGSTTAHTPYQDGKHAVGNGRFPFTVSLVGTTSNSLPSLL